MTSPAANEHKRRRHPRPLRAKRNWSANTPGRYWFTTLSSANTVTWRNGTSTLSATYKEPTDG